MDRKTLLIAATVAAIFSTAAHPALAASAEAQAAVSALSQIEADATKLQEYCKIVGEMGAAEDDEAKFDELQQQFEDLLRSFGPQFEAVLTLSETADPETPDGQALEAAFDKLDEKCG